MDLPWPPLVRPFAPLIVAFTVSVVCTPLAMRLARAVGAVDRPKADRWHRKETPLLGGVAISLGLLVAIFLSDLPQAQVLGVAGGAAVLFAAGLLDDMVGLRPVTKLVAQTVAAGVLVAGGVQAGWPEIPLLAVPLTIFWVVGITNAVNLLDNMDGLAAGVAGICGLAVAACAAQVVGGAGASAVVVALAVSGAAFGFLPWNAHPARVFMGDAGSLPLGFTLAAASLLATHREAGNLIVVLAAPLLALAVPIVDTTLVSVVRKWHGRKISQGGRDHLSHRLVALGMPERQAVQTLWLAAAVLGAGAVAAPTLGFLGTAVVLAIGLVVSVLLGVVLGRVKVYAPTDQPAEAERTEELRRTFLNYLRVLGPFCADVVFAGAAYAGAYLLRYEGVLAATDRALLEGSIAAVVGVQVAALAACRVYRGVWRYFGVQDASALARGVALASIASTLLVVFLWRNGGFSRAVFVIDAALFAVLVFGARSLVRLLSDAYGTFAVDGVRVLVVGGGDAGVLCLRALRARGGDPVSPVGIIDDDTSLARRRVQGVPILGTTTDLERLIGEHGVDEVVLSSMPDDTELEAVRGVVRRTGVRLTLSPYARAFVPL